MIELTLEQIKQLDMVLFLYRLGGEIKKKKSSKYGWYIEYENNRFWVRYDYKTNRYFYTNLNTTNDNGTIIDFIQNHIIKEKNIGKVKKYIQENINLF